MVHRLTQILWCSQLGESNCANFPIQESYRSPPLRFADHRTQIRRLCGDEIADQLKTLWGLDAEGELQAAWRNSGHPRLWYMLGESL